MPEISRFYGIVVKMYHHEHNPPHLHAVHGGDQAVLNITSLVFVNSTMPRRAERLLLEWARQHQAELEANWDRAQQQLPLVPIEPLD